MPVDEIFPCLVAARIWAAMELAGHTVGTLADELGITTDELWLRFRSLGTLFTMDELWRAAAVLDVEPSRLTRLDQPALPLAT